MRVLGIEESKKLWSSGSEWSQIRKISSINLASKNGVNLILFEPWISSIVQLFVVNSVGGAGVVELVDIHSVVFFVVDSVDGAGVVELVDIHSVLFFVVDSVGGASVVEDSWTISADMIFVVVGQLQFLSTFERLVGCFVPIKGWLRFGCGSDVPVRQEESAFWTGSRCH